MRCANTECEVDGAIFARGYCQGCYNRLRRKGTLARSRRPNAPGSKCSADGCDRLSHAAGLCNLHYLRSRPPEEMIWRLIRSRHPGKFPAAWTSLESFLAEVGRRPGEKYQLRRIDGTKPWSADNCEWREPVRVNGQTGLGGSRSAAYQRAWSYLRRFGLREGDITAMRQRQGDACPICTKPLELPDKNGKPVRICVDHDHYTGDVRGLLHDNCNKGIGALEDSAENCRRAAAYLESFRVAAAAE